MAQQRRRRKSQVMRPQQQDNAMGKAMGAISTIYGNPQGLNAAQGQQGQAGAIPTGGGGSQVSTPAPTANPLGDAIESVSLVSKVTGGGKDESAKPVDNAISRRQESQAPDISDDDLALAARVAEWDMNAIREQNPEMAEQLFPELNNIFLEMDRRFKSYGSFRPKGEMA